MEKAEKDPVIREARALAERAQCASLYPANELVLIAQLLEMLARRTQD